MAINKVVIAAAGRGTRMKHLTKAKSKHLIEICGRPFLSYLLDNLIDSGHNDIIIVTGHRSDLIEKFIKKYPKRNKAKIKIINQFERLGAKSKIYGTACPLMCVKDIIGKDNFLYVNGDHFYSVRDLRLISHKNKSNYISGIFSEHPERFGVLKRKLGILEKIIEKPKKFYGNLINVSLYKFTPKIFGKLSEIKKSSRGEYEITDAINLLAKEERIKVNELKDKDYWIDFGRPEDIKNFSNFIRCKE